MKILRYSAASICIFIFFIWANYFEVFKPLQIFFPKLHIIFFSFLIIFSVIYRSGKVKNITPINLRPFILFPSIGFILALSINVVFFKSIPHIQDSVHYVSMAKNFLRGQPHHPFIENYEFFSFLYMIPDGEKIYSLFLPGYSVFLIPFSALGITFLANPLLTALNIFTIGKIGQKLFDRQTAVLALLISSVSSFFVVMGGTFMAHSFCAFLTLISVYFFIISTEKKGWKAPLVVGIAFGWLVLIRPQNALFLFIPLFIFSNYLIIFKKNFSLLSRLSIAAAAFFPFLMILFWINYHYTGDFLLFKQDPYFNYSEPVSFCHRFGIGTGCPNSNWIDLPKEGLTWAHAFLVSYRRLSSLTLHFFFHPLAFIFVISAFFAAKNRKQLYTLISLLTIFLVTFSGYFFFYFYGNVFGPRYLYEVSFFLIIILAFGLRSLMSFKSEKFGQAIRILLLSFLTSAVVFYIFITVPNLYEAYSFGFWEVDSKLKKTVVEKGIHNAVVFIAPEHYFGSGFVLMDLADIESNDVIYVRNLGDKQNSQIMFTYPDRSFYMAEFEKLRHNKKSPSIKPLEKVYDIGEYHVELEDKSFPLTGNPDYCNFFPKTKYTDSYLDFEPPYSQVKQFQRFYFCRFTEKSQYYDFGQKINYSGKYRLSIKIMKGPNMGNFNLFIDDKHIAQLKTHGEKFEKEVVTFEVDIEKGFRKFRVEPSSSSFPYYFFIDYIDFYLLTRENLTIK